MASPPISEEAGSSTSPSDSNAKRPQFGNRHLKDETQVFKHNAWDDVEWGEEQIEAARTVVEANSGVKIEPSKREHFESEAGNYWNKFYTIHANRFFKDRNWLFTEFPELLASDQAAAEKESKFNLFEIGCGVGNTVYPILEMVKNENVHVYCCDFSAQAIELVRTHDQYEEKRCTPFVFNLVDDDWTKVPFKENSLDIVLMIFVMSALEPDTMSRVVKNIYKSLKPGGIVLFRDYGQYDLAQLRFKAGKCISEDFYLRGDGTRCYFFTQEKLRNLFTSEGFVEEQNKVDRRLQVNRGKQLKMYRVWLQAKFRKPME